jgi:hypothetical protein
VSFVFILPFLAADILLEVLMVGLKLKVGNKSFCYYPNAMNYECAQYSCYSEFVNGLASEMTTIVQPCRKNGKNMGTEKGIRPVI